MNVEFWLKSTIKQNEATSDGIIRDIAITSQMSHLKNVLKLSGCCLEFKSPALVFEYGRFERLDNILHHGHHTVNSLAWRHRIQIAIGITNAVLNLHTALQTPIIYRNLKTSNVVIDQHGVAKLFDFSFSISLPHGESRVEDVVKGTWGFADPEYVASGFLTQKSDVYSFGVILLVLVIGQQIICRKRGNTYLVDYVKYYMEDDQLSQILDSEIVKQGFDQQQLRAILDLGVRCTHQRGEDRPEMIYVARELRQIKKFVNR